MRSLIEVTGECGMGSVGLIEIIPVIIALIIALVVYAIPIAIAFWGVKMLNQLKKGQELIQKRLDEIELKMK